MLAVATSPNTLALPWKYRRALLSRIKALLWLRLSVLRSVQVVPLSVLYQSLPLALVLRPLVMATPRALLSASLLLARMLASSDTNEPMAPVGAGAVAVLTPPLSSRPVKVKVTVPGWSLTAVTSMVDVTAGTDVASPSLTT